MIALLAPLAICAACSSSAPSSAEDGSSEITIPSCFFGTTWDPMEGAQLFTTTSQAVYDPLIMVTAEGVDPQPWLAESFEISEDGYTISFKLREDVDFVDGTHFDAAGLEKYLDALFASETFVWKPRVVDQFGAEATATGEYTLDIVMSKQPVSYQWLWQFGLTPIASPAIVDDPSLVHDEPVGSGPYLIEEFVPDVSVTYERNPDYWNAEKFPYDRVTIQACADPVAMLNAVKSGQLDVAEVTIPLAQEAQGSGLKVTEGPGNVGTMYISDHNGTQVPALGDPRVREAMALAFDREAILQATNLGFGSASSQQFAEGQASYIEGADDRYAYDLDRAKELMAEAGYADGFSVTIPTMATAGTFLDTTNLEPIVQTSLAEIGIDVTYEPYSGESINYLQEVTKTNRYPIYLVNMPQTNWIVMFDENWGPYENAELQELIRRSREGDPDEQAVAYQEIGQFLLDENWYIAFSRPSSTLVSVPEVDIQIDGAYTNPKLFQYTPAG
ncbi:hypothetical protein C1I92_04275 [Jiangella anatolica]|uniref:Solute-binding protein family 5 domain-containing protein n=2 Tax=Jiangella anatolica TaxID=2670374 RepID=A0A2W2BK00_9ACTN|nr:hypothetical protein C1I92_04275 [Jiangella anatolica]